MPAAETHPKWALLGDDVKVSRWHHSGLGGKYLYRAPRLVGSRWDNGLRGNPYWHTEAKRKPRDPCGRPGASGHGEGSP